MIDFDWIMDDQFQLNNLPGIASISPGKFFLAASKDTIHRAGGNGAYGS